MGKENGDATEKARKLAILELLKRERWRIAAGRDMPDLKILLLFYYPQSIVAENLPGASENSRIVRIVWNQATGGYDIEYRDPHDIGPRFLSILVLSGEEREQALQEEQE
jgi:hypothetical protein